MYWKGFKFKLTIYFHSLSTRTCYLPAAIEWFCGISPIAAVVTRILDLWFLCYMSRGHYSLPKRPVHRLQAQDPPITFSMWDSCPWHSPSPNPVTPSSLLGPLAYTTRRSAWRDIRVGSGLTLITLVTRPLSSPQMAGLIGCAAPLLISLGPSHHFSEWDSCTCHIVCESDVFCITIF